MWGRCRVVMSVEHARCNACGNPTLRVRPGRNGATLLEVAPPGSRAAWVYEGQPYIHHVCPAPRPITGKFHEPGRSPTAMELLVLLLILVAAMFAVTILIVDTCAEPIPRYVPGMR